MWDQLGASVRKHIVKAGNYPFKIIKVSVTIPPAIFKEDVLSKNGEIIYDETFIIRFEKGSWTTKCLGGCCPYSLLVELINGNKSFYCKDPVTRKRLDIYIPHMQYMPKTGNLHLEMSLMSRNKGSQIWQVPGQGRN